MQQSRRVIALPRNLRGKRLELRYIGQSIYCAEDRNLNF